MKILDRYIFKELLAPFILGVLIFTFVMLANIIIRLIDLFVSRGISIYDAFVLLSLSACYILVMTIPMSVLLAVLVGFSRLSGDSEITAMRASGISIHRMMPPVIAFATCAYVLTSFIYVQMLPRTNQKLREMKFELFRTQASLGVSPHVFNTDFNDVVLYVNEVEHKTGLMKGIFIADNRNQKQPLVIVATDGQEFNIQQSNMINLRLRNGCTHELYAEDDRRYSMTPFSTMDLGLSVFRFENVNIMKSEREMTITELMKMARERRDQGRNDARQWVEIWKKTALPFACFVFAVLGVPLGMVSNRGGKSAAFATSIGLILIYYIFLTGGTGLAEDGKLSPFMATWFANFFLSLLAIILYFKVALGRETRLWNRIKDWVLDTLTKFRSRRYVAIESRASKFSGRYTYFRMLGRILDRHILITFNRFFLYILSSLLAISLIVHLFEKIDLLLENKASLLDACIALGMKIPYFSIVAIPFSTLVATILTIGTFTRTSELVAMKSSGISYLRICAPLIAAGMVITTLTFILNESIIPPCNQQVEAAWDRIRDRERSRFVRFHRWYRGKDGDIYYFQHYDPEKRTITGFSQFTIDSNMNVLARFEAKRMVWETDRWICKDGRTIQLSPSDYKVISDEHFLERVNPIPEVPDDFSKEHKDSDEMNIKELREYIRLLASIGFDTTEYEVDWHTKFSIPFLSLIMVLIGIGFATQNPRSSGGMVGIGISIFIGAFYFVFFRMSIELGQARAMSPPIAAWFCNVIFFIASLWNLYRVTQRVS
ncbi:LPS export ABC transporter permease LptG [bacterium]|nr:LPS export ABC transporter permease LptG [candidate division CSSED10-310 bacterium]